MTEMRTLCMVVLIAGACSTGEKDRRPVPIDDGPRPAVESAAAPDTGRRLVDLILTEAGLGPARMCAPLAEAAAALGRARDSTFVGESDDVRWPGKLVRLPDGHDVVLEASWIDSARVWRISTTSPGVRTRAGARVGMAVVELPVASGPLKVDIPEGGLALVLEGDSVGASVDSASEAEFHRRWSADGDWLSAVPRSARLVDLSSYRGCQHPDSAA